MLIRSPYQDISISVSSVSIDKSSVSIVDFRQVNVSWVVLNHFILMCVL